ncbi:N-acetyltransferase [Pseudodesulfovibrio sp.]|uniref:GNAT family N-acetyltransferase n=1 Tax=Pseudodesulfovibrio sp. TaxID=2035812 RepID=UPI002631C5C2|nr:N-acetyltransferase [Pseudodesulfovibrio sp.]MDD3312821.1 N-acetyltransferase [Pseudodesulfovibrio sp.]
MTKYTIRMVDPDDLTACHTIEALSFPAAEAAWASSLEKRINTYPEGFMVAELDGRVIAQVNSGSTCKDDITDEEFKQLIGHDPDGGNIVIFSLSVHPQYRKLGIGGKLLDQFVEHARDMGKNKVLLLCKEDLVNYYARHGFADGGVSASTHGGAVWHEMFLAL